VGKRKKKKIILADESSPPHALMLLVCSFYSYPMCYLCFTTLFSRDCFPTLFFLLKFSNVLGFGIFL